MPRSRLVFDRIRDFPQSGIDTAIPLHRKISQPIKSLTALTRQLVQNPARHFVGKVGLYARPFGRGLSIQEVADRISGVEQVIWLFEGFAMNGAASRFVRLACSILGVCGLMATGACTNSAGESDQPVVRPSIEILAMSRGRGVPETTRNTLQAIAAAADSALESGSVLSVNQVTIGLEGETRLCIVFRDQSALAALDEEIRKLAVGVDLLQVRVEDNNCPEN